MNKPKLFTKNFLIITFINFFVSLNFSLLMVIISEFAMIKFNSSPGEAGLLTGMFIFGALVARLFAGIWIGRIGQKKTLYIGLILLLATASLYFGANSVSLLLVIRFLHGIAFGIASTSAGTIVAKIVARERTGEGIGYFSLSVTVAAAVGPFLSMFISRHGSYSMIFAVCTIFAAFNMVMALFLSARDVKLTEEQLAEMKEFKLKNYFEPNVITISIVCMVIFFCYSSVLSFFSVYAREINLVEAAGFFYIVFAAVILFTRPFVGRMFDSKGENLIMYSAILIFIIGMVVFSQAYAGYMFLLAGAVIGLGFGALQSSGQAIAVKSTEPHRMGLAISTFYILADTGMGSGPLIFGLIVPFTGYRGMYLCAAVILAACLLLYYLLYGKNARHGKDIVKQRDVRPCENNT
jgi:MFS family permease